MISYAPLPWHFQACMHYKWEKFYSVQYAPLLKSHLAFAANFWLKPYSILFINVYLLPCSGFP